MSSRESKMKQAFKDHCNEAALIRIIERQENEIMALEQKIRDTEMKCVNLIAHRIKEVLNPLHIVGSTEKNYDLERFTVGNDDSTGDDWTISLNGEPLFYEGDSEIAFRDVKQFFITLKKIGNCSIDWQGK
jgi:hypothetical protein